MKKILLIALAVVALCSCLERKITLTNTTDLQRNNEMVEVSAKSLGLKSTNEGQFALLNSNGDTIPYQVMHYGQTQPQSIVFQATLNAQTTATYQWVKGTPAVVAPKVFARFVPERKDDFAWENDLAAYRMYGPALAPENPSNGVDLWLKCTDELIVDTFYYREHHLGLPYHVNYGKGLDCYKVGHTLGCGGVAPYVDGQLLVHDHYTSWEIIDQGPLRVQFRLTYPDMQLTITADAGAQLNRGEVIYSPDSLEDNLALAGGIFLHEQRDAVQVGRYWIAYAENAVSDAGKPEGRNYAAVVLPTLDKVREKQQSLLAIAPYTKGETFTYYFGGGWSEWQYPSDSAWFEATAHTAECVMHPLEVHVK